MAAKQKWSANKNGRQTKMTGKQKWSPNHNGRQTKMTAKERGVGNCIANPLTDPGIPKTIIPSQGIS